MSLCYHLSRKFKVDATEPFFTDSNTTENHFDAAHTQGDKHPHNVTEAEARRFIDEAYFALYFKPNNSMNFFGKEGAAYVQLNKKLIRTAFKRDEYNPKFRKLIEVYEDEIGASS